MTEKFEAVVVGAGPAGLSAAMELARSGVQTLVLERGKEPGAKNVTGGILYGQTNTEFNLDHAFPDLHEEAPLERPIGEYLMHNIAGDQVRTFDVTRLHHHEHKWSYAVLRAKLDKWMAERVHEEARQHGGGVLSDIRVKGPLFDDRGRIIGVETDELEPIEADVVIAADGATSEMARKAGIRPWMEPEKWFQGVKVVLGMDADTINERFNLSPDDGAAHLFAGSLFGGVRGGGFLYTNNDTLSVGTVFHLDALADAKTEPHALLDRLLEHPLMANWVADGYEELEYSAKLIPDGKKMVVKEPYKDNLLVAGDAAGHMLAQGPIIKGMNFGITAGIIAAKAYVQQKEFGRPERAGELYAREVRKSYVYKDMRPLRQRFARATAENNFMNGLMEGLAKSGLGRGIIRSAWGQKRLERMFGSPFWAGAMPDIRFGYATLPTIIAEETGDMVASKEKVKLRSLDDRIAALDYDTDVGHPHIILQDNRPEASGKAVHTCPVSSQTSSRGCYRLETVKTPDGGTQNVVAFDVQPCIECGTCAIMAETAWEHPRGGKGVDYNYG